MATLQRSAVSFRRQGSSGSVWDELYVLGEDGSVHYRDQLRPCQSTRERSSSSPTPNTCPRSMSTPAMNLSSLIKVFGKLSGQDNPFPKVPKSKSKKHKAQFQDNIIFHIVKLLGSLFLYIHYFFPIYLHNKPYFMYSFR